MPRKDDVYVNLITDTKKSVANLAKYAAGVTAAIMVVRKAAKVAKELTDAYFKQERAEAKLASALRSTNYAVGISATQMKKYAAELQKATGIGDEMIIQSQAVMTTFTKIGKETFPRAIEAAADMSAMFGQDLQQSVVSLGTALNDPIAGIGRLRRIGISFTEEQKNMIQGFMDVNDVASAQKVILDDVRRGVRRGGPGDGRHLRGRSQETYGGMGRSKRSHAARRLPKKARALLRG